MHGSAGGTREEGGTVEDFVLGALPSFGCFFPDGRSAGR